MLFISVARFAPFFKFILDSLLDIDTQEFKDMGGRYIFSAAEILNYKMEQLDFLGVFEDDDSVWRIFVYEVIP